MLSSNLNHAGASPAAPAFMFELDIEAKAKLVEKILNEADGWEILILSTHGRRYSHVKSEFEKILNHLYKDDCNAVKSHLDSFDSWYKKLITEVVCEDCASLCQQQCQKH